MNKLCFCPFCGHGAPAVYLSGAEPRYYVHCDACGAFGPTAKTTERAEHAWNLSNDYRAMLVCLVEVIKNRPVLESFLKDDKGARTTWKMAQEVANR